MTPFPRQPPRATGPTAILLHGLASSPLEFSGIRNALLRAGVELHTPELPDYSATGPMRPHSWRNWLASGERELQRQFDRDGPVVLGGLCIGAVLAGAGASRTRRRPDPAVTDALLPPIAAAHSIQSLAAHVRHA